MAHAIAFVGFGEAGMAFATDLPPALPRARAFDLKTLDPATRRAKLIDGARTDVRLQDGPEEAVRNSCAVLSVVTADQALWAAEAYAPLLDPGTLWLDLNSVAPATKQAAAAAIEAVGGLYADVAVMAPVQLKRRSTPLLVSGPHAEAAMALLAEYGFDSVRKVEGGVGAASAIKMVRSVIVKGAEALTAECLIAARRAGVLDEVLTSLEASAVRQSWRERADYNLDRMLMHGVRRAYEMEEVAKTLDALDVDPAMTRGTINLQRILGGLGLRSAPTGLEAKLDAIELASLEARA